MGRDADDSEEVTAYILRIPKICQNEHEAKYLSLSRDISFSLILCLVLRL
jgi:hypothetical protein